MQTEQERLQTPELPPMQNPKQYTPRPGWQVVLAWTLLAVFLLGVILYYFQIAHRY